MGHLIISSIDIEILVVLLCEKVFKVKIGHSNCQNLRGQGDCDG